MEQLPLKAFNSALHEFLRDSFRPVIGVGVHLGKSLSPPTVTKHTSSVSLDQREKQDLDDLLHEEHDPFENLVMEEMELERKLRMQMFRY